MKTQNLCHVYNFTVSLKLTSNSLLKTRLSWLATPSAPSCVTTLCATPARSTPSPRAHPVAGDRTTTWQVSSHIKKTLKTRQNRYLNLSASTSSLLLPGPPSTASSSCSPSPSVRGGGGVSAPVHKAQNEFFPPPPPPAAAGDSDSSNTIAPPQNAQQQQQQQQQGAEDSSSQARLVSFCCCTNLDCLLLLNSLVEMHIYPPPFFLKKLAVLFFLFFLFQDFEVSDFFVFGSPLALVLAYRKILLGGVDGACAIPRPPVQQVYNLFHPTDPLACRMEPLLSARFSRVPPINVPR